MKRKVFKKVRGYTTEDGAGVKLIRVLGNGTVKDFDPILMLDSFDSINPDEYTAGFPMHPHRGIETISYVIKGSMLHKDSLGSEDAIGDGEVQWMTAGSGILHEEQVPAAKRLLGLQLWLNLPAKDKMCSPAYKKISNEEIQEFDIPGGHLRLLAGAYEGHQGYKGKYLPLNYYDIELQPQGEITLSSASEDSVMIFTVSGEVSIEGEQIAAKTAVKLTEGEELTVKAGAEGARFLYIQSKALQEPVAWAGPIVMNNEQQLRVAIEELRSNNFIKEAMRY